MELSQLDLFLTRKRNMPLYLLLEVQIKEVMQIGKIRID